MNRHYNRLSLFIIIISFQFIINAQSDKDLGSWDGLGIKYELNNKFNVSVESRLRAYTFYNNFYYYEGTLRTAYNINNFFSVAAGGGRHESYSKEGNFIKPVENSEIRIYEDVKYENSISGLFFDHRIRFDQRFLNTGYENRIRYRGGCSIPLNNSEMIPRTFILSFWEEVFIADNSPHFQLNRLVAGVNYKLEHVTIQTAFVNQLSNHTSGKTTKNFLLTTFLFEFKRKNEN